nr:hypothetical protein [uncultured bacterium]
MYDTPSTLLLSRTAESAYWAGRYLERAEGTARLIKTHSEFVIDLPRSARVGWAPLLAVVGVDSDFAQLHPEINEEIVVGHLASNAANTSSIRASIGAVHRNLRVVRSVMPVEGAEVLTELYHHVEDTADQAIDRRTRGAWLTSVMRGCQTLSGILGETMSHDDAYCFFTVGRQLERADLMARVLDVQAGLLKSQDDGVLAPYAATFWHAALRSVSALQAFRRQGRASTAEAILAFLIHDPKCPRTVECCLIETSRWLLEIPGHEPAMAACASITQMLQEADIDSLVGGSLHLFAEDLQAAVAGLHDCVEQSWFTPANAAVVA